MSAVGSRRGLPTYVTDCVDCGAEAPGRYGYDGDRQRRWAVKHVADNPGHSVHFEQTVTRIYATPTTTEETQP